MGAGISLCASQRAGERSEQLHGFGQPMPPVGLHVSSWGTSALRPQKPTHHTTAQQTPSQTEARRVILVFCSSSGFAGGTTARRQPLWQTGFLTGTTSSERRQRPNYLFRSFLSACLSLAGVALAWTLTACCCFALAVRLQLLRAVLSPRCYPGAPYQLCCCIPRTEQRCAMHNRRLPSTCCLLNSSVF